MEDVDQLISVSPKHGSRCGPLLQLYELYLTLGRGNEIWENILNNLIKRPSGGKDNNYIIYIDYD
jgi:hypothetical protein